jgi:PD-(D/E)XK nuclease family transposase
MLPTKPPPPSSPWHDPPFADPKTDFAFKRIFGSEKRKDVLVAFLNDILDLDENFSRAGAPSLHG